MMRSADPIVGHLSAGGAGMGYFSFGHGDRTMVILPGLDVKSVIPAAKAVQTAYHIFEDDYTVYVFDRSDRIEAGFTIRDMARDTAAAMRELGLRDAYVFGASQGGMIALQLALDAPDLVCALALGSSAARARGTITAVCDRWIELAQTGDITVLTADFVDRLYSVETVGRFRDFLTHMNDGVIDGWQERFVILAGALEGFDVMDQLSAIRCPVLVIGVEGDRVIDVEESVEMARALNCELYLYSDRYGHCAFDEARDYQDRIFRFFENIETKTGG